MKPTSKLRFIERSFPMHPFYKTIDAQGNTVQATQTFRILQQWWETVPMGTINTGWSGDIPLGDVKGEWRDVPLEKEE